MGSALIIKGVDFSENKVGATKNLAPANIEWTPGYYISSSGVLTQYTGTEMKIAVSSLIHLEPRAVYTIKIPKANRNSTSNSSVHSFTAADVWVARLSVTDNHAADQYLKFKTNSNAYIKLSIAYSVDKDLPDDPMILLGERDESTWPAEFIEPEPTA